MAALHRHGDVGLTEEREGEESPLYADVIGAGQEWGR